MSRGTVTMVFDDGYKAILHDVVPILDAANIPAVFAIPLDSKSVEDTEHRPVASWKDWIKLKDKGHEIAAHGMAHTALTNLSIEELENELKTSQATLNATTIIYPGGAYNNQVIQLAKKYFKAGRTVERGFETEHPADIMRLKTINYSKRNFSLWKANLFAVWAWLTNSWLIETYHLVGDQDPDLLHNVPIKDFEKHISFVKNLSIKKSTISEFVAKL